MYSFGATIGWRASIGSELPPRFLIGAYPSSPLMITQIRRAPNTEFGFISADDLLGSPGAVPQRDYPLAESAGVKLALHPDVPPISPVCGIERIATIVEAYERILAFSESKVNGIALCQGNFRGMGKDIATVANRFGNRLHYVHFRDVKGTSDRFKDTWHDDGPTDMLVVLRAYRAINRGADSTRSRPHNGRRNEQ